jgi:hypothetical protein
MIALLAIALSIAVFLLIRFGPDLSTALTAASTARRMRVWHGENACEAERVDRERADIAAWELEMQQS